MLNTSPDVISLLTAAGEVLCSSGSSVSAFGYRPEELTGHSALEFIHSDDRARSRDALRTVLDAPGAHYAIEVRVRRKDGEWSHAQCTITNLLETPRIGAVMVTCRLATATDATEALPHRPGSDGLTSQIEDFAHAVAHDLREPLRTISMFTEILLRKTEATVQGKEMARNIVDGVNRMTALLNGLHAFAIHVSAEPAQRVDVNRIVAEVLRDVGHAIISSRATVTADRLPFVQSRAIDLNRVFQNLIMNAIKYRGDAPP